MEEQVIGKKLTKSEFIGWGALVQLLGLLFFFWFPIGPIIGVIMLVCGSRMSLITICSHCGNKLSYKGANMCPVCKALFRQ